MRFRRSREEDVRLSIAPLIDIVFLLLVFFIYAMLSMAVHRGQSVDLPQSGTAELESNEAISITIQAASGAVVLFLDEEQISLVLMSKKLQEKKVQLQDGNDCEVQIFADKLVPYQELFQVLDHVKQAGITRISLQAEPTKDKP